MEILPAMRNGEIHLVLSSKQLTIQAFLCSYVFLISNYLYPKRLVFLFKEFCIKENYDFYHPLM